MAAVTFTSTAIKRGSGSVEVMVAQVALNRGDFIYKDSANGDNANLADADAQASADVYGVALSDVAAGQTVAILLNGGVLTCDGLTKGTPYFVHTTAGKIGPIGDLLSGDYITFVGIATATTSLPLNFVASGVTI